MKIYSTNQNKFHKKCFVQQCVAKRKKKLHLYLLKRFMVLNYRLYKAVSLYTCVIIYNEQRRKKTETVLTYCAYIFVDETFSFTVLCYVHEFMYSVFMHTQ